MGDLVGALHVLEARERGCAVIVVGFFIEVQIASIAEHYTEFGRASEQEGQEGN